MLNYIWLGLVLAAVLIGGWHDIAGGAGTLQDVTKAAFDAAQGAVMRTALPLVGIMALWLGVMRLAERAGLVQVLARALRPILTRLFPDVPPGHPAMGSMVMNIAANMLGLDNAATPLGLRAMEDLETLNPHPGTATNAMCTFLALNTAGVQLIPATAIGVLAISGSVNPSAIAGTALLATSCAAMSAVVAVKILEKLPWYRLPPTPTGEVRARATVTNGESMEAARGITMTRSLNWIGRVSLGMYLLLVFLVFLRLGFPEIFHVTAPADLQSNNAFLRSIKTLSLLSIPFMLSFIPLYAALRGVKVYEELVEGGKEGLQVALRIIPYLVVILVAIGMFRAAGGIELIARTLQPVTDRIGFPTDLLPLCLVRPLSGSGSLGVLTDIVKQHGPDSLLARTAGTLYGCTETTFYVLAVYFGSVGVRRSRHAVLAGLFADFVSIVASVVICRWVFG
jgi:spore maturation protein SpmA